MVPMLGIATGAGVGTVLGAVHVGVRPPWAVTAGLATILAMIGSNGPMTVLGVSDPASWSMSDWISDALPHAAYGLITATTLQMD